MSRTLARSGRESRRQTQTLRFRASFLLPSKHGYFNLKCCKDGLDYSELDKAFKAGIIRGTTRALGHTMNIPPDFLINFWPNFLANFASDFLVGIVIVGLISAILKKAKKIEAKVTARLEKESDSRFKLVFALTNSGKTQFKANEVYYHIYVPSSLSPSEYGDKTTSTFVKTEDGGYIVFTGLLDLPCFPGRSTGLIDLRITPIEPQPNSVLYFLSTAHGFFPKGIKVDEIKGVKLKKLGRVAIEAE